MVAVSAIVEPFQEQSGLLILFIPEWKKARGLPEATGEGKPGQCRSLVLPSTIRAPG
jgi:hypothetical protein